MNKEQAYDSKIHPLMSQIIKICKKHKIAMVASFAIPIVDDPSLEVTTRLLDENKSGPAHHLALMKAVYGPGKVFVDPVIVTHREDGTTVVETVYP